MGQDMDEEQQAAEIHRRLKEKKVKSKQLVAGKTALAEASPEAVAMSSAASMDEVRKSFKPAKSAVSTCAPSSSSSRMRSCAPTMARSAPAPAAASAPAPKSFGSSLFSLFSFSSSSAAADDAPEACLDACEDEAESRMVSDLLCDSLAPAAATSTATPMSYDVSEDDVSLAQCKRMVKKSRARQGW